MTDTKSKGKRVFGMTVSLLRQIVTLVMAIADEVLLHFDKDGIRIEMADPSHVAMVVIRIKKESMSKYVPGDDMVLDPGKVKSLLADAEGEEIVELYVKEGKEPAPVFRIGNMTRGMTYFDPKGMSRPKVPDLTCDAVIKLDLNSIRRGMKNIETFTTHVAIECDPPNSVILIGEGTVNDVLEIVPEFKIVQAPPRKIRSMYKLDYLMEMIKHLGKDVTISFSNEYPMKMTAKLEEGLVELGTVEYLLAPKIETPE